MARFFPLLPGLIFALGSLLSACSSRALPVQKTCVRKPLAARLVGANMVDLTDYREGRKSFPRGYGSKSAKSMLGTLKGLGFNSVTLPAELTLDRSRTHIEGGALYSKKGRTRLRATIADARRLGLSVTLVPHLLLADGTWRGDIRTEVDVLLKEYARAIDPLLRLAEEECVDVFTLGVEFKGITTASEHDASFKTLVNHARHRFKGHLAYAANWDELEVMRHAALFDSLGVNAFFPLGPANSDDAVLAKNAKTIVRRLDTLANKTGRPLVVNELGFRAQENAFVEPWLWPKQSRGVPLSQRDQARAYDAMLTALSSSKTLRSISFWLVPSDIDDVSHKSAYEGAGGFSFLNKRAQRVVSDFAHLWLKGAQFPTLK